MTERQRRQLWTKYLHDEYCLTDLLLIEHWLEIRARGYV